MAHGRDDYPDCVIGDPPPFAPRMYKYPAYPAFGEPELVLPATTVTVTAPPEARVGEMTVDGAADVERSIENFEHSLGVRLEAADQHLADINERREAVQRERAILIKAINGLGRRHRDSGSTGDPSMS